MVKCDYGVNDYYRFFKKNNKEKISRALYGKILKEYNSNIRDKIVSQIKLDIPTYTKEKLPQNLLSIKPVKPGSRNL